MAGPSIASNLGTCPGCKAAGIPLKEVYGVPVCDKCASKCFSEKVRQRIQEAYERQQEQKKRELWNRRVDLVKKGVKNFSEKNYVDALRSFREYIIIIENHHRVAPGTLSPSLFDPKKEAGDILLIAGIYWDMAKIYDQMKGRSAELQQVLNKFVEFSIGRPHAVLSAETMRKYLKFSENRANKAAFEGAQKVLITNMNKCFIATACFGEESHEVSVLRSFRDNFLLKSELGRALTELYYVTSPTVAAALIQKPLLRPLFRIPLRLFVYLMIVPSRVGRK